MRVTVTLPLYPTKRVVKIDRNLGQEVCRIEENKFLRGQKLVTLGPLCITVIKRMGDDIRQQSIVWGLRNKPRLDIWRWRYCCSVFAHHSLPQIYHYLISAMSTSSCKDFQGLTGRTCQIVPSIPNMGNFHQSCSYYKLKYYFLPSILLQLFSELITLTLPWTT